MNVRLNNVHGIDDAMVSLYMSKGTYTEALESEIRELYYQNSDRRGFLTIKEDSSGEDFREKYRIMLRIGKKHTTVLRYIDFSFTNIGLHRGAQDDLDSHAQRFNNRIIRTSTRLCKKLNGSDKSEWYVGKVINLYEALRMLGMTLPDTIESAGETYILADGGYVNKSYIETHPEEEQDVRRGLYNLAIPSNCIIKCDIFQFAHVYKMRNRDSGAHPELRELIESLTDQIADALAMGREEFRAYLMGVMN